jgi:hypothetical protein
MVTQADLLFGGKNWTSKYYLNELEEIQVVAACRCEFLSTEHIVLEATKLPFRILQRTIS